MRYGEQLWGSLPHANLIFKFTPCVVKKNLNTVALKQFSEDKSVEKLQGGCLAAYIDKNHLAKPQNRDREEKR